MAETLGEETPGRALDALEALRVESRLSPDGLALLRRLTRHRLRAVWEPACREAGRRAPTEPLVDDLVGELLDGPMREMRLRGIVALAEMAPQRPDLAYAWFDRAVEEPDLAGDPVFMDVLCMVPPRLPADMAAELLELVAGDPRLSMRAAAAASLVHWPAVPPGMLLALARDPAPLVRCSAALTACRRLPEDEALQAADALMASEEPFIREFLASELPRVDQTRALLNRLCDDADDRVRAVARGEAVEGGRAVHASDEQPMDGYAQLAPIERELDANPAEALEILRPLLDDERRLGLLHPLSHLCRDVDLGNLCRGLHLLLGVGAMGPDHLMASVLELIGNPVQPVVVSFRALIGFGLDALHVRSAYDAVYWATRVRADLGDDAVRPWARGLERLCALADVMDAGPGDAIAALEEGAARIRADFGLPERIVLLLVVERWSDILDQELQDIAGVTS